MTARIAKFDLLHVFYAMLTVSALAGTLIGSLWDDYRLSSHSPIAANLPPDIEHGSVEFRARILARFPVGTPQNRLIQDLESQGFKLLSPACPDIQSCRRNTGSWFDGGNATGRLTLHQPRFPCKRLWNVVWQANADGAIAAIWAEHQAICLW